MNLVERWFGHLDNKAIRRGVFLSVADLQASIQSFLKAWNQHPKPFDPEGRPRGLRQSAIKKISRQPLTLYLSIGFNMKLVAL